MGIEPAMFSVVKWIAFRQWAKREFPVATDYASGIDAFNGRSAAITEGCAPCR
jgi:hypothetical protein